MSPRQAHCRRCGARLARDNAGRLCAPCQAGEWDTPAAPPVVVPAAFWEDPVMRETLCSRHMGRVIRAYRTHPFHGNLGLSQEVVASWAGLTQGQLSRVETGSPIVHLDRLIQWARLLGIPAEFLWFSLPHDQTGNSDDVRRRQVIALGGATVVAGCTPASLVRATSPSEPQPLRPDIVRHLADALLPGQSSAVTAEPLSHEQLAATVRRAWILRQQAQYESLGLLLSSLIGDVERTAEAGRSDDRCQALSLVVHTYNAASSLLKKLGDSQLALIAADRAVRSAQVVNDPLLSAAAVYRLVNVLLPARRLDETRRIASQAAAAIEPGKMHTARSLAMWGGLLLTAAVAAARQGDESGAWEILGEARAASRFLGADHADLYAIFGPTNVAIHGVQVAVELGNGKAAIDRAARVDPDRLPPSLLERRAQFLIDMAHGYALAGQDGEAVAVLEKAERTAPQEVALSADVRRLVGALLTGRHGGASSSGLRGLASRLGIS